MQRWYVAQTQPMAEHKALAHLHRQGFEVYLPRYLKRRSHARRVDHVPAPVFPRYLFVAMDIESCRWRAINSTVGVTSGFSVMLPVDDTIRLAVSLGNRIVLMRWDEGSG